MRRLPPLGRGLIELRVEHDGVILAATYSPGGDRAVVALHGAGELDSWSPVAASVDAWREAAPDAEIVVIPGAEHDLTRADGTLDPAYESKLVDWLAKR